MVFSLSNVLEFFKRRTSSSSSNHRNHVERSQIHQLIIDDQPYYVSQKSTPLSTLTQTRSKKGTQQVKVHKRNRTVVLYQVDRQVRDGAIYEMCFELTSFGIEYGLMITKSQIIAEKHLNSAGMHVLNEFVPYLVEQG